MLQIDDQLQDVEDGMDELKENLTQDNAVSTLKELAESGRCSIPQYDIPDEQCMMMVSIGGHAPAMFEAGQFKKQHSLHQKKVLRSMPLILFYVIILA
jgi:hypothetical protein